MKMHVFASKACDNIIKKRRKKMKKLLVIVVVALMLFSFVACGQNGGTNEANTVYAYDRILKNGYMTVGIDPTMIGRAHV